MTSQRRSIDDGTANSIVQDLKHIHGLVRDEILRRLRSDADQALAQPAEMGSGDISYHIDLPAEAMIEEFLGEWGSRYGGVIAVCEGFGKRADEFINGFRSPWRADSLNH